MDPVTALAEAELAYHKIMTNKAVVSVWYNSRRTEFSIANVDTLKRYIADLKAQIAGTSVRRSPAGVRF